MQLSPDIRYVSDGTSQLAVVFDGCYFTAYHVGSENIGINISMEMVVGVYPEVSYESLIRIGRYQQSDPTYGVWALEHAVSKDAPPAPKNVVQEIKKPDSPSLLNLQQRLNRLREGRHDLIKTLETSVEALDDIVASPHKPATWATVLLPILEASAAHGISAVDMLKEAEKLIQRKERFKKL